MRRAEDDLVEILIAALDLLPFGVAVCRGRRTIVENAVARGADIGDPSRIAGAHIVRVGRGDGERPLECRSFPLRGGAVALFIADPDDDVVDAAVLRELYGLTPAEVSIIRGLLRGADPRTIAAEGRLSTHTVRTQLRSIFAKTDTHAQADLMRVLLRGIATLRDGNTSNG